MNDNNEVTVSILNHKELEELLKNVPRKYFRNFMYLKPKTMLGINMSNSTNYIEDKDISKFELQETLYQNDLDYNRAIVVKKDNDIAGITYCDWQKTEYSNMWEYNVRFIDVHKKNKRKGISKVMMKTLDSAEFIKGKVLHMSEFADHTPKKFQNMVNRELKAKDYVFVPDYIIELKEKPKVFGIYQGK